MAEIGAYYITILPSMNSFTGAMNKALGAAGRQGGNTWLANFKATAFGTALGNLASRAGNMIADGIGRGIERLDTIQNFPKIMESLGYSTEEADRSIKLIMEHLDGLPTATDDMVSLTQAIADSTGDLDLATRAALGFNDMMLANGASTAEMTNATGILNRILGKQNATVNQWMSLQSVMPAQLSMVAEEMLGAGHSSEELRDALNNGTVSWNDFLAAIVKLDEEGNGHVASFEEQARSMTGGIGTAIDNVKNRIAAGWAAIFEAIGREDIANLINTFSTNVKNAMISIADWITDTKEKIANSKIGENLKIIFDAISDAIGNLIDKVKGDMPTITDAIVNFIDRALQWIVDHGELCANLLKGIAAAMVFKEVAGAASSVLDLANNLGTLGEVLPMVSKIGDLPAAFSLVAEAGGPLSGIFGSLASGAGKAVPLIEGLVPAAEGAGGAVGGLGGVLSGVSLGPIALAVGAIAGIIAVLKTLWDNNEGFRNAVTTIWGRIQETFAAAGARLAQVGQAVGEAFGKIAQDVQPILTALQELWNNVCNVLAPAITVVIDTAAHQIEGIVTTITGVIQTVVGLIQGFLTGDWTMFTDGLKATWDGVWEMITAPVHAVFDTISGIFDDASAKWDEWKAGLQQKNEEIKSFVLGKWEEIKSGLARVVDDTVKKNSEDWQTFTTNLQNWNSAAQKDFQQTWNNINNAIGEKLESIRSAATSKFDSMRANITNTVNGIRDGINSGFEAAKSTVLGIFDGIRSGIEDKLNAARDAVSNIIEGIKNLFNFDWSLPAPALPHIDWHWESIGGVLDLPVFDGISWYAKGGIFDAATIIGVGEAGREAALPLNTNTYREMAKGIVGEMGAQHGDAPYVLVTGNTWVIREEADIDRIADAISRKVERERLAVA